MSLSKLVSLSTKGVQLLRRITCRVRQDIEQEERWMSVVEIAQHLGVQQETVYTWIEEKGHLAIQRQ